MAVRYWVGGAGTWNSTNTANWSTTSGGAGGASVPVAGDQAYFDAGSGTTPFTVNRSGGPTTILYLFMGVSGITLNRDSNLTVTGNLDTSLNSTAMTGNASLIMSGTGTIQVGASVGNLTVSGSYAVGGTLRCSSLSVTGAITTFPAIVATGGITVNGSLITAASSSTISATQVQFFTGSTITLPADLEFTITGASTVFNGGGNSFHDINFTSTAYTSSDTILFQGVDDVDLLTIAIKSGQGLRRVVFDGAQNIAALTATSSDAHRRLLLSAATSTNVTITDKSGITAYCDFRNINAQGTAWNFSADGGNCGGNTNITFPSARTVYRNSAGGAWIDGTARWATTSGGTAALSAYPRAQDTAVIDEAGAAGALSLTAFYVGNISASTRTTASAWSGVSGESLNILGDCNLGSGVTVNTTSALTFSGIGNDQDLTVVNSLMGGITSQKPSGTLILASNLTTGLLSIQTGDFDAADYAVTASSVSFGALTNIDLGASDWTLTGTSGTLYTATNTTTLSGAAGFIMNGAQTGQTTFNGAGLTYNSLVIAGSGNMTSTNMTPLILGSNTFGELSSTRTTDWRLGFGNGTTQNITTWGITGSVSHEVVIRSQSNGNKHTLNKLGGGQVSSDYLNIVDSDARPFTTWYAGDNSTDSGNNSGWTFSDPVVSTSTNFLMFF